MKKITLVLSLNLFIPLFILIIIPSVFIRYRHGTSLTNGHDLKSFITSSPIQFSFNSTSGRLVSLNLFLKNPLISNISQISVDIISADQQRQLVFYGQNVGDPGTVPIKFPPFPSSSPTTYIVKLNTNNTDSQSLYLLTDASGNPLFESIYQQSNLYENLKSNFRYQYFQLLKRSPIHSLLYFLTLILLNYFIFFHAKNKE